MQKGIALSHRVVLDQVRSYGSSIKMSPDDRIASWLPLYHDMGLIACFVAPSLVGTPIIQMSPFDWVGRPTLLLETIGSHQATLCWLPNFAYAFMAKAVRDSQMDGLDLTSIRAFINCSEPVTAESHDAFLARFGDVGATPWPKTSMRSLSRHWVRLPAGMPFLVACSRPNTVPQSLVATISWSWCRTARPSTAYESRSPTMTGPNCPNATLAAS